MLHISEHLPAGDQHDDTLILPFDSRQKSRLRVTLSSGDEAGLFLERGTVLRGGDRLRASDGRIVGVVAANEQVLYVTAQTPLQLARAAYHLGNRHVPLQIGDGWLRLEQDHVLKEMLDGFGVQVEAQQAPFEPEAGAYGGGHHHAGEERGASIRPPQRRKSHHD